MSDTMMTPAAEDLLEDLLEDPECVALDRHALFRMLLEKAMPAYHNDALELEDIVAALLKLDPGRTTFAYLVGELRWMADYVDGYEDEGIRRTGEADRALAALLEAAA